MKLNASVALLLLTYISSTFAADTKSSTEQALRDLDAQWAKAAAAKDVDKTVSYYSDDAIVLPPNQAIVTTKAAIRDLWKGLIDSATSISWTATRVEAAKSGDMAYVSGTYDLTLKDASGNTTNDRGKYLEVWEKQADGNWKCGADTWNSDLPAMPAASAEKR
jgi:ketosteroid isomerase-like protein